MPSIPEKPFIIALHVASWLRVKPIYVWVPQNGTEHSIAIISNVSPATPYNQEETIPILNYSQTTGMDGFILD